MVHEEGGEQGTFAFQCIFRSRSKHRHGVTPITRWCQGAASLAPHISVPDFLLFTHTHRTHEARIVITIINVQAQ